MFANVTVSPVVQKVAATSVAAPGRNRLLYPLVVLVVLVAWLVHSLVLGSPWFGCDDAYIVIHNAQVLHWGHDPNYPGTPALAGTTSPVHLAIVSVLLFVLPPPWALDAAGWLAAIAYALGILHSHASRGLLRPLAWRWLLPASRLPKCLINSPTDWRPGSCSPSSPGQSRCLRSRITERSPILSVLCGLMPYIRPDLAPAAALLLGANVIRHRRAAGSWRSSLRPSRGISRLHCSSLCRGRCGSGRSLARLIR